MENLETVKVFGEKKLNNYIVKMDTNLFSKSFSNSSEEFHLAITNSDEL